MTRDSCLCLPCIDTGRNACATGRYDREARACAFLAAFAAFFELLALDLWGFTLATFGRLVDFAFALAGLTLAIFGAFLLAAGFGVRTFA